MSKVLIVYDSRTGNTEKMARAVADGARTAKGAKVTILKVDQARMNDLIASDAIILGSPTYYGDMTAKMKAFIDRTNSIHGKLAGKVGGAFTSSGDTACGAETCVLSILHAMLINGMIIQGRYDNKHYGPTAVEAPSAKEVKSCKELGRRIATLAAALEK